MITMVITIQGCAKEPSDFEKASECISQFMRNTYEVFNHTTLDVSGPGLYAMYDEYEERIKPYATQHAIDEIFGNRLIGGIAQAATKHGFDMSVSNVSLDQFELDEDKIFTDYETTLLLLYEDGTHEEIFKKGKLQLIVIDGVWKINHEKSNSYPIIMMSYDLLD